jgi:iron complex outermembrane recepter protein
VTNAEGHIPGNTAKKTFSLFGEYRFDSIPGLSLNAAAYYVGARPVSNADVVDLPAVTTYSLGGRYRTKFGNTNATFQFNVDNATNKSYWSSADASSANPLVAYGLPRLIRVAAKFDL